MQTVELYKPEGQSLGFKVVNNPEKHLEGIFIQEIHDNGIAARYVCVCAAIDIALFLPPSFPNWCHPELRGQSITALLAYCRPDTCPQLMRRLCEGVAEASATSDAGAKEGIKGTVSDINHSRCLVGLSLVLRLPSAAVSCSRLSAETHTHPNRRRLAAAEGAHFAIVCQY